MRTQGDHFVKEIFGSRFSGQGKVGGSRSLKPMGVPCPGGGLVMLQHWNSQVVKGIRFLQIAGWTNQWKCIYSSCQGSEERDSYPPVHSREQSVELMSSNPPSLTISCCQPRPVGFCANSVQLVYEVVLFRIGCSPGIDFPESGGFAQAQLK